MFGLKPTGLVSRFFGHGPAVGSHDDPGGIHKISPQLIKD